MNKFYPALMWVVLILVILLIFFSIYGAFLGSAYARSFFNSLPLAVYWFILGFVLIIGFISLQKLIRVPALLLIHSGCILVLLGAMYGSEAGHRIQNKLFGVDKIRRGQMLIYQGRESNKVTLEKTGWIRELPFSIGLKNFRIEYYQPKHFHIRTSRGNQWKIPVQLNTEFNLGDEFGKVKILREFRNFKITIDGDTRKVTNSKKHGYNPALEVQIEHPDGSIVTRYVFEHSTGHIHPGDKFSLSYRGVVRDYISDLAVIENGKTATEKNVEVNHPLHFGGYYFYQHSYDTQAAQYSVLMVVSDTGLAIVYAGYLMLCAGVFWQFWLKHLFTKTKYQTNGN